MQLEKIMDKIQKDQTAQMPLLKSMEQKQGVESKRKGSKAVLAHASCTQHHQKGRQTTQPPLQSDPWSHHYPHLIQGIRER